MFRNCVSMKLWVPCNMVFTGIFMHECITHAPCMYDVHLHVCGNTAICSTRYNHFICDYTPGSRRIHVCVYIHLHTHAHIHIYTTQHLFVGALAVEYTVAGSAAKIIVAGGSGTTLDGFTVTVWCLVDMHINTELLIFSSAWFLVRTEMASCGKPVFSCFFSLS